MISPLVLMVLDLPVPWYALLGLMGAALVAGWVDAVVGGGGLVQLPSLLIGLPADTPTGDVLGTNKVSSVAGTVAATITYLRSVTVDWLGVLPLVLLAALGSTLGSLAARLIPKAYLTPIVLVALIAVGLFTIFRPTLGLEHAPRHTGWAQAWRTGAIGLSVGGYDGLLGPGTGSFFLIALVAVLGYGFLEASARTKIANLATNIASIIVFGAHGEVLWLVGGCMALANLTGGWLGARTAVRLGSSFVRKVFLVVVSVLILKLAYDTALPFIVSR
ncbi:sulfite exporter TauE/SafE family protein [Enemella evansiae]|uniref:sulfite exporter TauE/SafE family protein n=1 Tax=Enemella evansiae TaxID=2016499 RepID=UPI001E41972F|nr:TSUP family transporter [Enemella evansiae]